MISLFLDTAVLLYATGGEHELRSSCRALVAAAAAGEVELHISVEAVQEFIFHRLRRVERGMALAQTSEVVALCRLHPFDATVVRRMIELVAGSELRGRDAVHVATAQLAGFTAVVSPDPDFEAAPGLTRLTPDEAAASLVP